MSDLSPSPDKIRNARHTAGLTQTQAANLIYSTQRTWQDWEGGRRHMHPGLWDLFNLRAFKLGSKSK